MQGPDAKQRSRQPQARQHEGSRGAEAFSSAPRMTPNLAQISAFDGSRATVGVSPSRLIKSPGQGVRASWRLGAESDRRQAGQVREARRLAQGELRDVSRRRCRPLRLRARPGRRVVGRRLRGVPPGARLEQPTPSQILLTRPLRSMPHGEARQSLPGSNLLERGLPRGCPWLQQRPPPAESIRNARR